VTAQFGKGIERKRFLALHVRGVSRQEDDRRTGADTPAISNAASGNVDEVRIGHRASV